MPIQPHTELAKLRIRISNYRNIIKKKRKGIKKKNCHTWSVVSRDGRTDSAPTVIATFTDKQEALDFYQDYMKKRLEEALDELRKLSPNDIYLEEPKLGSPSNPKEDSL